MRLGRDPHHVHGLLERCRSRNLGVEVTEENTLDTHDAAVPGERLVAHQEQDVAAGAGEGSAEKGTDTTGAKDSVSHHGETLAPVRKWCP